MSTKQAICLTVNGQEQRLSCEPRRLLLEVLRDDLGLTGTKEGCSNGNCGACTVLVDGLPVTACLVMAVEIDGAIVETVEGLADANVLHPLQSRFIELGGFQCGFCTPGILMNAKALLAQLPDPNDTEVRTRLAGNLCRCTGYEKIVRAVQAAAADLRSRA